MARAWAGPSCLEEISKYLYSAVIVVALSPPRYINIQHEMYLNQDFFTNRATHLAPPLSTFLSMIYAVSQH